MPTSTIVPLRDFGTLLLTRERGRAAARALPKEDHVALDLARVEVVSSSFLHELAKEAAERGIEISFLNPSREAKAKLARLERLRASSSDAVGAPHTPDTPD